VGLGAVGQHGPDLAGAGAGGLEDEVAAVGSPAGAFVAAGVARDFKNVARADVHDVDVVVAGGAAPTESDELAIGRPGRVDEVTLVRDIDFLGVGAVGIHHVKLGNAAAVADEDDGLQGFGIPGGRSVAAGIREGETLGAIAAGVRDVQRRSALHGRREHHLRAIGRPGGGRVGAFVPRKGDDPAGVEGVHADLGADYAVGRLEAGEGDAGGIRRPARRESDGVEVSNRALVGAVVIHDPDFLVTGAGTDKRDLRGADAGEAAGKFGYNFVGKLVGEFADLVVGGSAAVDLADDGFVGGAADVEHPGGDGDFGGGFGEIAEGDEVGVEGRIGPESFCKFVGSGRNLRGIETGGDEFDDAGEGEVFTDDLGE